MLDPKTRDMVTAAPERRAFDIAVHRLDQDDPALKHRAGEVRQAAWVRLRGLIVEAALAEGLRRVRHRKGRPEVVLTGPAVAWMRFFGVHRGLVAEPAVEFRHFVPDWGDGLSLSPWV